VENGIAPDRIIGTARVNTPWPDRTRPLCPYPQQARYKGAGSIEVAENFDCVDVVRN
jgi:feruloyl esterase